jgi:hypothetical protein
MKRYRLKKLKLDEVSLVASGDDPMAQVVIAKTDKTPDSVDEVSTLTSETAIKEIDVADEHDDIIDTSDIPADVVAYIEELESVVNELSAALPTEDEIDAALVELAEQETVLAKADPVIQELVFKAQREAEEAREIAKAERDARITREYIEVAKSLQMIDGDSEHLGRVLKSLSEHLPEDLASEVSSLLVTANERLEKSALFGEIGTAVPAVSSSVEALASEIRKAEPALSYEEAVVRAYETNPNLYLQES